READGITVLDDSTRPERLFLDGVYRLSEELTKAGTVPQVASRRCSIKFKGWVIDTWLAGELRGRPYRHAIGFNTDEASRVERDRCYGGASRTSEYPLRDWGMGRAACEDYLRRHLGVSWPKSCCFFCPFARGKEDVLARYRAMPELAAEALLIEHVALTLNPKMTLYADRSLWSVLVNDVNQPALDAFEHRLERFAYALYRVRRIYKRKGGAERSVEKLAVGGRLDCLRAFFASEGKIEKDPHGFLRRYLRKARPGVYPAAEEMLVVAPA